MKAVLADLARTIYAAGMVKTKDSHDAVVRGTERGFLLKRHEEHPDDPLSPVYFSFRTPDNGGVMTPDIVERCMHCLAGQLHNDLCGSDMEIQRVVGLPNAGTPFAEDFPKQWARFGHPEPTVLTLKKQVIGGKRRITGPVGGHFQQGDAALLIDDLITGADTKWEGIKALEKAGLRVIRLAVMLDREQGGVQALREGGHETTSVFTLTNLLNFYVEIGMVSKETRQEIFQYIHGS